MPETVKWAREVINTSPENLQLDKFEDNGTIIIRSAGIYEITFAFFVPTEVQKPLIQIRVNNKPMMSMIDSK